jgi:hypothetical protein
MVDGLHLPTHGPHAYKPVEHNMNNGSDEQTISQIAVAVSSAGIEVCTSTRTDRTGQTLQSTTSTAVMTNGQAHKGRRACRSGWCHLEYSLRVHYSGAPAQTVCTLLTAGNTQSYLEMTQISHTRVTHPCSVSHQASSDADQART